MNNVTILLAAASQGDPNAADQLLPPGHYWMIVCCRVGLSLRYNFY
ncbi:MAG: hypothetical protein JWM11_295 [Planctomycetaceae bacterium]|nr:hypothetical protein [Planctomycetaceae bacterium]